MKKRRKKIPADSGEIKLGDLYILEPKNSYAKSFYGKASVIFDIADGREIKAILRSYETDIATCDRFGLIERLPVSRPWGNEKTGKLTLTSSRHLKEFRLQRGDLQVLVMGLNEKKLGNSMALVM